MSHDITHWACFRLSRACMCTRRQMWLLLCWLEVNWFCRIFAGPNYSAKCLSCQPYSLSCANFHKILPTLLMYSFILLQRFCNHVFMIYTKHTRFVSWTSNKHLLLYTWYYLWPQKIDFLFLCARCMSCVNCIQHATTVLHKSAPSGFIPIWLLKGNWLGKLGGAWEQG